jgi:hypothetical protein
MKEVTGNLWDQHGDAICIPTNGFVKKCGECVMGAGVAKQAAQKFPDLPKKVGDFLKANGNRVGVVYYIVNSSKNECKCPDYTYLLTFPTKYNWFEDSDPALIEKSCQELLDFTTRIGWTNVILPRPGCANGNLKWADVKPICEKYFDDRFTIVDINGDKK